MLGREAPARASAPAPPSGEHARDREDPTTPRASGSCAPPARSPSRTYVIVTPLPEVKGPDGPEEQQHRPRNEDHSSDLEQPRGAGGLHGHRGVRLRAGTEGHGSHLRRPPRRCPRSAPRGWGVGWGAARPELLRAPSFAALPLGAWHSGVGAREANFPRCRATTRLICTRQRAPPPDTPFPLPFTPVCESDDAHPYPPQTLAWGVTMHIWVPHLAPTPHIRWHKSLTPLPCEWITRQLGWDPGYSPEGCKTRRRQALPGRWELCPSSPSWLRPREQTPRGWRTPWALSGCPDVQGFSTPRTRARRPGPPGTAQRCPPLPGPPPPRPFLSRPGQQWEPVPAFRTHFSLPCLLDPPPPNNQVLANQNVSGVGVGVGVRRAPPRKAKSPELSLPPRHLLE